MIIDNRPHNSLRLSDWRTNYVLKPDMELLKISMMDAGWLQPLVVRAETQSIIDGSHRWFVAGDKDFQKKHGSLVPVVFVDCDEIDAMVLHVRMNRARGEIFAKHFSRLLKQIVLSDKYSAEELEELLIMSPDEVDLMLAGGLLKKRKVAEHQYSKAWVPVEAPSADVLNSIVIERPPNPDR